MFFNVFYSKINVFIIHGTAYRNSPTLFRMVPSQTLTASPSPKLGVRNPHPKLQSKISGKRVLIEE